MQEQGSDLIWGATIYLRDTASQALFISLGPGKLQKPGGERGPFGILQSSGVEKAFLPRAESLTACEEIEVGGSTFKGDSHLPQVIQLLLHPHPTCLLRGKDKEIHIIL